MQILASSPIYAVYASIQPSERSTVSTLHLFNLHLPTGKRSKARKTPGVNYTLPFLLPPPHPHELITPCQVDNLHQWDAWLHPCTRVFTLGMQTFCFQPHSAKAPHSKAVLLQLRWGGVTSFEHSQDQRTTNSSH